MRTQDPKAAGDRHQEAVPPPTRPQRYRLDEVLKEMGLPLILALDDEGEVRCIAPEAQEHQPVWSTLP